MEPHDHEARTGTTRVTTGRLAMATWTSGDCLWPRSPARCRTVPHIGLVTIGGGIRFLAVQGRHRRSLRLWLAGAPCREMSGGNTWPADNR